MSAALNRGPVLVLDAAGDGALAALVSGDRVLAERRHEGGRGSAAALPAMAAALLEAGTAVEAVAVTVGPGSFTGVRAALALALGIGTGAGVPVHGVSVGDAIRAGLDEVGPVWVVLDSKRGRVFLDRESTVESIDAADVPAPESAVALAGDAALLLAGRPGFRLLEAPRAEPLGIARAAAARPRPPVPLYIDGAAARPGPALRPAPA